ncbi:MAG: hybrid sensor histidine kinase/response regulator [Oscillospiraceae bacterium]
MDQITDFIPEMTDSDHFTGLFSLELNRGKPVALFIENDFCEIMGLDPSLTPQELFREWLLRVREEDLNVIYSTLKNCTVGVKSLAKFKWNHPIYGWITAVCGGIHSNADDSKTFVHGFFKGALASSTQDSIADRNAEAELYKIMLTEAMMDAFTVCGVCDLENNSVLMLKDKFNISKILGRNFTYDMWRDTVSGLVAREDAEHFDEASSRKALLHYFNISQNEMQDEFRCLDPGTHKYRWMKLRFVRFKHGFSPKYKEMFIFRDITDHHHTEFKDALRIKLINGLTLPYEDIDLVNLKTGRLYSSGQDGSQYAENFEMRGFYDDEIARTSFRYNCNDEKLREIMDKFSVRRMRERFAAGEKIIEAEVRRMNTVTKVYEWVRIQASLSSTDENGEPHMAIVTVQAINAEKERQLKNQQMLEYALRAEQQYKQAILSTAIAVYTFNVTTDTLYDEVIERDGIKPLVPMLGLSCPCSYNEYINRKAEFITSEQESEMFRKTFSTASLFEMFNSNHCSLDAEYEFAIDGKKGVFREAVILTKDLSTEQVWGLSYIKNVTLESEENKRIEQALRDAFNQAQRANSAKTLFMSQMSHDIRTPLNSILGMSAIAQENVDDRERVIDCLSKIEYSGRHLLELINNVLDLSAIESGKTTLSATDFDITVFIDELLSVIKSLSDKHNHTLITDIKPLNKLVNGDKVKLRQLLTNVLSNAVKYTPDGGTIKFTAEELEPDRHDIARYMFTIEDNGIGMSEEVMSKVFDPFVRADNSRVTGVEGTGLGMAIAQNIARMMNGGINVRSELGKGSVFEVTVCLKRSDDHAGSVISELSMDEPVKERMSDYDFGGRRILLAEDLEFNAEIASEFLSEANIVTEVAADGEQAVQMFSQSEPGYYSLIFMDIQMPKLNGHEAARRIRALPRNDAKDIPIIAMTANAFVEDIRTAKEAGMNGHIAKPLEISRLIAELKKWFGDKKRKNK